MFSGCNGSKKMDLENKEVQRQVVDCFVNTVYLFDDNLVVNFNFGEESRCVILHEVQEVVKAKEAGRKNRVILIWLFTEMVLV